MLLMMALMAQEITGPPGDAPAPVKPAPTRQRCTAGTEDIVVCGRADTQRLSPLPAPQTERVFGPAATRISPNKTLSAETEAASNPFAEGPRAMVRFKLDF